ncbi:hypothetical protein GA0115255_119955 [Streptomyces sp. Ncost-T6T-2b]|nr:hypothetical protein GA0115255_119955 [Streptomyces sp. Ncost-T6T-2b]
MAWSMTVRERRAASRSAANCSVSAMRWASAMAPVACAVSSLSAVRSAVSKACGTGAYRFSAPAVWLCGAMGNDSEERAPQTAA